MTRQIVHLKFYKEIMVLADKMLLLSALVKYFNLRNNFSVCIKSFFDLLASFIRLCVEKHFPNNKFLQTEFQILYISSPSVSENSRVIKQSVYLLFVRNAINKLSAEFFSFHLNCSILVKSLSPVGCFELYRRSQDINYMKND